MGSVAASRIEAAVAPVVAGHGLDLEEVEVRPAGARSVVRVVVDRDGGVTLDDVAEVSRACSAALDAQAEALAGPYVLEVTSPGADRPLTHPRHWRRAAGRLVAVRRREGGTLTGRVVAATDEAATLRVGEADVELPYAEVAGARVEVEIR